MRADPFQAVRAFEADLVAYTGAPYAVAVNSCTMALLLACAWFREYRPEHGIHTISLPAHTYVGCPQSVIHAGFEVEWREESWSGEYQLEPLPVWDSARRFTKDMFKTKVTIAREDDAPCDSYVKHVEHLDGTRFQCLSFHISKILGHSQGGAILHNHPEADAWLRRARFDGRTEAVPASADQFDMIGWHCYMSVDVAAALRWKLSVLPDHNADLPCSDYPDLSKFPIFSGKR